MALISSHRQLSSNIFKMVLFLSCKTYMVIKEKLGLQISSDENYASFRNSETATISGRVPRSKS